MTEETRFTPTFFGAEGQWQCGCGWANHELRRACRNCGKFSPERIAEMQQQIRDGWLKEGEQ